MEDKHNPDFLLIEYDLLEMIINSIDVSHDPLVDRNNRSLEKYERRLVRDSFLNDNAVSVF